MKGTALVLSNGGWCRW